MMRWLWLVALVVTACTRTTTDSNATAIEIATTIAAGDGVTQLRISGTVNGMPVFDPGVLPAKPRPLSGEQTATVLLPPSLDGMDVLVRVDALAGQDLVHTGGGTVTVQAGQVRHLDVTLGMPAVCGDGMITAPFETCDDDNTAANDGCTPDCQIESGWSCVGTPSQCNPLSSHKEITSYAFLAIANPGLHSDAIATINGTTISIAVPNGTNVSSLVATFAMTGTSARVAGATQVSGATPNDFSQPVQYTVVADDGSVKTYSVMVTVASSSAKDITGFRFLVADNPALSADVVAQINGTTIAATVPTGTDVTALIATFDTTGTSVKVGTTVQTSGSTANDFTSPLSYVVTAADNSTKAYMVSVAVARSSSKAITSFVFRSVDNPTLGMDVIATINGMSIDATVPAGADVTTLVATFATTGMTVDVGATPQVSGMTSNDFTNPVVYTVTAADLSTQMYTVTVGVAASSAKELTAFSFMSSDNPTLGMDVVAAINGTAITATVPAGTNVTALVATFATTGASVSVGGTTQTSGVTANDFSSPVTYTVTAVDSSTKTFTVTVNVAAGSAKDITSFGFLSVDNLGMTRDVVGTINGTTITAIVPANTTLTSLVATFATTGTTVKVGTVVQASGITANDFSASVTYTVVAQDNSTKTYTVTVTVAAPSDKSMTSFEFDTVDNPGLPANAIGVINGNAITLTVPVGTDVTALIARFTFVGKLVKVGNMNQNSGHTAQDFTSPVTYTVYAQDNSTKAYVVTLNTM